MVAASLPIEFNGDYNHRDAFGNAPLVWNRNAINLWKNIALYVEKYITRNNGFGFNLSPKRTESEDKAQFWSQGLFGPTLY